MNYNSKNIKKEVKYKNKEYLVNFECNSYIKNEKVYFTVFRSKLNTSIKINIYKILELHNTIYSLSSVITTNTIEDSLILLENYIDSFKQTHNEFKMSVGDLIRVFGFLYKLKEVVIENQYNKNRLKKIFIRLIIINHQHASEFYFMFFHLLELKENYLKIDDNYLINEYDLSDGEEYDFYDTKNIDQILDF